MRFQITESFKIAGSFYFALKSLLSFLLFVCLFVLLNFNMLFFVLSYFFGHPSMSVMGFLSWSRPSVRSDMDWLPPRELCATIASAYLSGRMPL